MKRVQVPNFFWSVFSRIWTEYSDLRGKSPYSVQIRKNKDQKKLRIWTLCAQWNTWGISWGYQIPSIEVRKKGCQILFLSQLLQLQLPVEIYLNLKQKLCSGGGDWKSLENGCNRKSSYEKRFCKKVSLWVIYF